MADETTTTDKPLATLADTERKIGGDKPDLPEERRGVPSEGPQSVTSSDPVPAADRLRAFEDEELPKTGVEVTRMNGRIERGTGSAYDALSPARKRKYAALEKVALAEQKVADAKAAVGQAEADCASAEAEVDAADKAIDDESENGRA